MLQSQKTTGRHAALIAVLAIAILYLAPPHAEARNSAARLGDIYQATSIQAAGTLEVAFSPNEGSERLVIKVIDAATHDIHVLAYSFTSAPIVDALLRAKKRGVSIFLLADAKSNLGQDRSGKSRAALSALTNAGCDVRTISTYPIHHDKVIIVDRQTVELGSYNYSDAAAHRNSENVLVNWHNPALAEHYLTHFERNWRQSVSYKSNY